MFQIRASPLGPVCVQNGGAVKLRYGGPICFCSKLGFRTYWAKTGRSNSKATRKTPITTALGGLLRGTAATNPGSAPRSRAVTTVEAEATPVRLGTVWLAGRPKTGRGVISSAR